LAAAFFVTSILLTVLGRDSSNEDSILDSVTDSPNSEGLFPDTSTDSGLPAIPDSSGSN
jgi:preprotein translocase subunit SecG